MTAEFQLDFLKRAPFEESQPTYFLQNTSFKIKDIELY